MHIPEIRDINRANVAEICQCLLDNDSDFTVTQENSGKISIRTSINHIIGDDEVTDFISQYGGVCVPIVYEPVGLRRFIIYPPGLAEKDNEEALLAFNRLADNLSIVPKFSMSATADIDPEHARKTMRALEVDGVSARAYMRDTEYLRVRLSTSTMVLEEAVKTYKLLLSLGFTANDIAVFAHKSSWLEAKILPECEDLDDFEASQIMPLADQFIELAFQ